MGIEAFNVILAALAQVASPRCLSRSRRLNCIALRPEAGPRHYLEDRLVGPALCRYHHTSGARPFDDFSPGESGLRPTPDWFLTFRDFTHWRITFHGRWLR